MLQSKFFRDKRVAVSWLILISVLFCLPGSALPKENWLDRLYVDKWVHVGLFAVLIFLWRWSFPWESKNYNWALIFFAFGYGLMVEFVQLHWIPNRSFDLYDVLADLAGSIVGLFVWLRVKKNKPL